MKSLILLILTSFLFVGYSHAQHEQLESDIKKIMEQHKATGLSVAVIKNNKLAYVKSFGLKNIEQNELLDDSDIFRIASISKSFAATAIMQLIEKGKMSLDDDFSDLIGFKIRNPKFPEKVITLRMVLSHTSSINDSQGYFNFDVINPEKNKDYAKSYNAYAPGEDYQYCNLNYNMVGGVIERSTGKRYDTYIQENILRPLGIYGGYDVDLLDSTKFATLYEYNNQTKKFTAANAYPSRSAEIKNHIIGYTTPLFSPTGGMKISAKDLAVYMQMHMNYGKTKSKSIISKKSSKLMQTPISKKGNYGLALTAVTNLIDGQTMVGHTGSAYGLHSSMFFDPIKKNGFVVLTNGSDGSSKNGFIEITSKTIRLLNEEIILKN